MEKFKIKKELHKYYIAELRGCEAKSQESWRNSGVPFNSLEKVEKERIEVGIADIGGDGSRKMFYINNGHPTEEQRELCEGILNEDPELAKKFLKGELGEVCELTGTIPNKSEVPDGLGDGFKITNNTDHEIFVSQKLNEIIIIDPSKAFDTCTETFESIEGNLITPDCEKEGGYTYEKDQRKPNTPIIELFIEWVRKEEVRALLVDKNNGRQHLINSFKEHINSKG